MPKKFEVGTKRVSHWKLTLILVIAIWVLVALGYRLGWIIEGVGQ